MCEEPTTAPCLSCGRARCAFHLVREMCGRCTEAIGREMERRSSRRFWLASTLGVGGALALMIAHMLVAVPVGVALAVGAYLGIRAKERRWLIARMGPSLSAFVGELPPLPRPIDFPPEREHVPPGSS